MKKWVLMILGLLMMLVLAVPAMAQTGEPDAAQNAGTVSAPYTVEFTYDGNQYVMPGDSSVRLSAVLDEVGLTGEAEAEAVSDESLFSASNATGEWIVTAHRAFSSTEWMKVTIGGVVYEITVTDDIVLPGDGTAETPYLIGTSEQWQFFSQLINTENATYGDKYYKLTADISIEANNNTFIVVGQASDRAFRGHFDGGGHTLTFNYEGNFEGPAPFRYVNGATIENLKVTGTISDRKSFAAGIAGYVTGNSTIQNCTSSVTINGSNSGWFGGLVGSVESRGTLNINNCLFNGSMKGSVNSDCGGFVGYNDGTVNITDSLCSPLNIGIGDTWVYAFVNDCKGTSSLSCAYRTWDSPYTNMNQGTRVYADAPDATLTQRISCADGGTYYAKGGAAITGATTIYKAQSGTADIRYAVEFNGAALAKGTDYTEALTNSSGAAVSSPVAAAGTYTLTVTGTGSYAGSLSQAFTVYNKISTDYLDAGGTARSAEVTPIAASATTLSTGWYAVTQDVTVSDRINVNGDVHLILCDRTTLTAKKGISVTGDNSLTLYAQSNVEGTMGKLTIDDVDTLVAGIGGGYQGSGGTITINGGEVITTGGNGAGIGGGDEGSGGTITINGGKVTTTSALGAGIGGGDEGSGGTITINGGKVTTTSMNGAGIGGGYQGSGGAVTINGGKVTATSMSGASIGGEGAGIGPGAGYSGNTPGTLTMSLPDANGSIKASSYKNDVGAYTTVTVKTGHYLEDGNGVIYSSILYKSALDGLAGVELHMYSPSGDDFIKSSDGKIYTILNDAGWNTFCIAVNGGNDFSGKTVKLGADISVSNMAGDSTHQFAGNFDGQGHTLTVEYTVGTRITPFPFVNGGTFQNLHVSGTICAVNSFTAGMVSSMRGTVTIRNCRSSVVIKGSDGTSFHGGFVGTVGQTGNLTIDGCVFDGKILTEGTKDSTNCGGFVATNNGTVKITNSLYAPATISSGETEATGSSFTFVRDNVGTSSIHNSYYTRALGQTQGQGTKARSVTAGADVTVDFGTPSKTYSVSGITVYSTGLSYNGTFYAGKGETVPLTLGYTGTPASGTALSGYSASPGTLGGAGDPYYTLTMPAHDVTVSATFSPIPATVPTITAQPVNLDLQNGVSTGNVLAVAAEGAASHALSYQWYSNTTESVTGSTLISGANNASYAVPTDSDGTVYYYCVVTATRTDNGEAASVTSVIAAVTVISHTHSFAYSVTGATITATCGNDDGKCPLTDHKATLTIIAPTALTYDGTAKAATVTGEIPGVTTPTITYTKAGDTSFTGTPAGAGEYTASISLGDAAASVRYTIVPKSVSITGLTAENKEYDGTSAATVTGTGTIEGKVGSDDVSVDTSDGTATFDSADVGTDRTVTFSGYALSGESAGNYTLSSQPANVTANITAKPITITANGQSVELKGAIAMGTDKVSISSGELASGHSLHSVSIALVEGKNTNNAGEYDSAIVPSGAVIWNASSEDVTANYAITYVNGKLTVTKIKARVTTAPTAITGLTYTGTDQQLITAGEADTAMEYALGENADTAPTTGYGDTVPSGKDVKSSYYVWYRAKADANHDASEPAVVTASIGKATINSVAVSGINTPKATENLDTEATTDTTGVTLNNSGTITWNPAAPQDGKAEYAKAYTAAVTATSAENYTFADTVTATVNGQSANATKNDDGTLTISYTFGKTALNPVTITAADKEVTYSADGIAIPVEGMFTIPGGAGAATYAVENGTGVGTYDAQTGKLTVTKCGTITIKVSTAESDTHAAGAETTATLTVNKANNPATIAATVSVMKSGSSAELVNNVDLAGNVTLNGATGAVSYSISGDANGCTLSDSVLTAGSNTGTVTVNVSVEADDNYNPLAATPITVTITNKQTQTIAAENMTVTYGDTGKSISASVTEPATGGGAISYAVKDGSMDYIDMDASTGALTIKKAGTATVVVTAAETSSYAQATKEVTVTINTKAMTVNASGYTGYVDQTAHGITVTVTDPASGYTVNYGTVEGTYDQTTSPTWTEVGTLTVYYQVTADNYITKTGSATVTISEKQPATVTKVPTAKALTYTGSPQALVSAGTAEGGEMQYALGTETEATQPYTTSIPTGIEAGTYYVWYKVIANASAGYSDSDPICIPVTIAEAKANYSYVSGAQGTWQKESGRGLSFHITNSGNDEQTFSKFTGIQVDGKPVDKNKYEAKPGSVIINLKPTYLETLSVGEHKLKVVFDDGNAETSFTIIGAETSARNLPQTGDAQNPLLYAVIELISVAGIGLFRKRMK